MTAIDRIDYDPGDPAPKLRAIVGRSPSFSPDLEAAALQIVTDVRQRGDAALVEHTRRLDGADLSGGGIRVSPEEIEAARRKADPSLVAVIEAAAANIRRFHEAQRRPSWFVEDGDGVILGKRVLPIERVGLLVPGASAPLFSTLLMAAVPAKIAGVPHIAVATPPRKDGTIHPAVLAAAHIAGVDRVYRVFGAQAVAALAHGTASVEPVYKIVGPGHPIVQLAKKLVFGTVDVDTIAGPSEIVVLADDSADPRHVAADLLSQAEHGSGFEAAVCVTPSAGLAAAVVTEVARQIRDLSHRPAVERALDRFGAVVLVRDMDEGVDLVNRIAPEHVEIIASDPWRVQTGIRNAGAVFLGPASTEPVGDYFAGTNHILPTAGAARFASSLSVDSFLKSISLVAYTPERLRKTAGSIIAMAEAEGLDGHAAAVRARLWPGRPTPKALRIPKT